MKYSHISLKKLPFSVSTYTYLFRQIWDSSYISSQNSIPLPSWSAILLNNLFFPTQFATQGQWWSILWTQKLHSLQWCALIGFILSHFKQYDMLEIDCKILLIIMIKMYKFNYGFIYLFFLLRRICFLIFISAYSFSFNSCTLE